MNNATSTPLVVDLDGTLTPTDTLIESLIKLIKQSPLKLLHLLLWLLKGRAAFKDELTSYTCIATEHLSYHESLLTYLVDEKGKGRRIILATAAHKSIAEGVSTHLGLFDDVLATDSGGNLKGKAKLEAIRKTVGEEFVYAGNSHADTLPRVIGVALICAGVFLVGRS